MWFHVDKSAYTRTCIKGSTGKTFKEDWDPNSKTTIRLRKLTILGMEEACLNTSPPINEPNKL
jgi:hypothetical protein